MHDTPRCAAHTRTGRPCSNPPVTGATVCRMHGGASPQVKRAAERRAKEQQAAQAVVTYGLAREIDPHTALLEELHRTAGHVAWLQAHIAELEQTDLTHLIVVNDDGRNGKTEVIDERPNVFVDLYQRERKHFADVAKTCIAVGIEERRITLAEQQGALLAQVIRGVLSDLGVADRPEVATVVRKHLALVA